MQLLNGEHNTAVLRYQVLAQYNNSICIPVPISIANTGTAFHQSKHTIELLHLNILKHCFEKRQLVVQQVEAFWGTVPQLFDNASEEVLWAQYYTQFLACSNQYHHLSCQIM